MLPFKQFLAESEFIRCGNLVKGELYNFTTECIPIGLERDRRLYVYLNKDDIKKVVLEFITWLNVASFSSTYLRFKVVAGEDVPLTRNGVSWGTIYTLLTSYDKPGDLYLDILPDLTFRKLSPEESAPYRF